MRTALLIVAIAAAVAHAKPERRPPLAMPALRESGRDRSRGSPVIVIGPRTPRREQPAVDEPAREKLQRLAATATGLERLAALDALTAALEQLEPPDAELELLFAEIATLYERILAEPALESYPYADELIVRAATSVGAADEQRAEQALVRMVARFPRSPFGYEAHLALAKYATYRKDFAAARRHLELLLATQTGAFARFARLELASLLATTGDYRAAVAQFRVLIADDADRDIATAAADSMVIAYSHAGRADLAAALFDHVDRTESADRLRRLAGAYADRAKPAEESVVLRAAIARESDRTAACLDRADLVGAMTSAPNRLDAEVAIAELAEAVKAADTPCAVAADLVVGTLAFTWHAAPGKADRGQMIRVWTRASELATTPERRETAKLNVSGLREPRR